MEKRVEVRGITGPTTPSVRVLTARGKAESKDASEVDGAGSTRDHGDLLCHVGQQWRRQKRSVNVNTVTAGTTHSVDLSNFATLTAGINGENGKLKTLLVVVHNE
eukprot:5563568-Heterocapsa_arctica.AAC.1